MDQTNSPINVAELLEIMDHDVDLLKECLNDFVNDYPAMLDPVRSAIERENWGDLAESAHAMKGTLRYLAAFTAAELALRLENGGKAGGCEGLLNLFADLEKECGRIRGFIERYQA